MDKIWYILLDGKEEGPFSQGQLLFQNGFNPDTLTRKEGSSKWLPARKISELRSLFEDKEPEESPPPKSSDSSSFGDSDSLAISADPPFFSFWLMFIIGILLILFYFLTQNL